MCEKVTPVYELLTFENPVFEIYVFWSAILVLKILLMFFLTVFQRFKKGASCNPEDVIILNKLAALYYYFRKLDYSKENFKYQLKYDDPDVERSRRAHRNDMENILPFLTIGFLYVLTNPEQNCAISLFHVIGVARIIHTLVYAVRVVMQPARGLIFCTAYFPTTYMAIKVILYCIEIRQKRSVEML